MSPGLLFEMFALAWVALLAARLFTHVGRGTANIAIAGLSAWLLLASFLAFTGFFLATDFPPRLVFLLVPMAAFWTLLGLRPFGKKLAEAIPMRELIGLQSFRIVVELFLLQLMKQGFVPKAMTFEGHNFDILTGVSALVIFFAWDRIPAASRGKVARIWNWCGVALLANVVITGVLSAPGPLQQFNRDQPNIAVLTFPYVLIPALFVLSALTLHILALRKTPA